MTSGNFLLSVFLFWRHKQREKQMGGTRGFSSYPHFFIEQQKQNSGTPDKYEKSLLCPLRLLCLFFRLGVSWPSLSIKHNSFPVQTTDRGVRKQDTQSEAQLRS
jgi:hypothetical protein